MARPLRAVTSGIEAMNRAVSGIAAYNVAIGTGMSHAASVEYAIQVVEDTQGNYSSANAPALWDSALGKAAFQFKKYPLMILNKLGKQISIDRPAGVARPRKGARRSPGWPRRS